MPLDSVFLKRSMQNALAIELKKTGLDIGTESPISVYYDDEIIGQYVADIIVAKKVILELKAVKNLLEAHEVQLVT